MYTAAQEDQAIGGHTYYIDSQRFGSAVSPRHELSYHLAKD